jgi:hypothetical protein
VRDIPLVLLVLFLLGNQALGPSARQEADQAARNRRHRARDDAERRQEHREDGFGVPADDDRRQEVLADQDVDEHARQECGERWNGDARPPGDDGEQDRREGKDQAQQQPRGHEELDRIVEVIAEAVVAAALRHQTQRQLHEGAERRLDGPDVDRRHGEQEERERNHYLGAGALARSMSPAPRPPLARSRRSRRAIRPPSAGSW